MNDKDLLRWDDLEPLKKYLDKCGIGWSNPKSPYQALVVRDVDATHVVTMNAKRELTTPQDMRFLIQSFRMSQLAVPVPESITDTQRLDFLLGKSRKVVVELIPGVHYAIYVEEGFMGDKHYPAAFIGADASFKAGSPEVLAAKRQAIDLAIKNQ